METIYQGMMYAVGAVAGALIGLKLAQLQQRTSDENDKTIEYPAKKEYLGEPTLSFINRPEKFGRLEGIIKN